MLLILGFAVGAAFVFLIALTFCLGIAANDAANKK